MEFNLLLTRFGLLLSIAQDNENKLSELAMELADLKKEIAAKIVKLSLLMSQRDKMM